jgi:hypothetical protein
MNTEHPLYNVLKDYYTNLSDDIHNYKNYYNDDYIDEKIDNSLLFQYIEDTYKIKDEDKKEFEYFLSDYLECDKMYFVNMIKTSKILESYCYFTNRLLDKFGITYDTDLYTRDNYEIKSIGKYTYLSYSTSSHCFIFIYI